MTVYQDISLIRHYTFRGIDLLTGKAASLGSSVGYTFD